MTNRSIPWFAGEKFDEVSVDRFTRRLADMVDTHAALPASVGAWQAYAELLLEARRNQLTSLDNTDMRELLEQLELVRAGDGALVRYVFVPGPDERAALWLTPVTAPRCNTCGLAPDACQCDLPAFDDVPFYPFAGRRYTCNDDGLGVLITRIEDKASVYIQSADERAIVERDMLALWQLGYDTAEIADTIGEEYDHVMEKED